MKKETQENGFKGKVLGWMKNNPTQAKIAVIALLVILFCVIFVTCKKGSEQPAATQLPATAQNVTSAQKTEAKTETPDVASEVPEVSDLPEEKTVELPAVHTVNLPGNLQLELRKVSAGSYTKGLANSKYYRAKNVTIAEDFYVGIYEVSQAQYQAVMKKNPARFKNPKKPVENVSWNEATMFCDVLNNSGYALAGWRFTLPTSDQWEYACRAGSSERYAFGKSLKGKAHYNFKSGTVTVESYRPNKWGLYNMHGNVWEWCLDSLGKNKEIRGGAWNSEAKYCTSYLFGKSAPTKKSNAIGFRIVMVKAD